MSTARAGAVTDAAPGDTTSAVSPSSTGRGLPRRAALGVGVLIVLGVMVMLPTAVTPSVEAVLLTCMLYALLATAWNIIGGFAGQLALGNALFFGVGAYVPAVALIEFDLPATLAAIVALPIAALVAAVVGWLTFRSGLRGVYFAVATLVTAELARVLVKDVEILGRSEGLFILRGGPATDLSFATDRPLYYVWLAALVVVVGLVAILARRKFGYFLLALRNEEDGARALGIRVEECKRRAFMLSAVLTSLAGSLYVMTYRSVQPDQHLGLTLTLATIVAAVLGGRGTVMGPVVGGFAVGFLQYGLTHLGGSVGEVWFFSFVQVLYGAVLMALILFAPRGLWGSARALVSWSRQFRQAEMGRR